MFVEFSKLPVKAFYLRSHKAVVAPETIPGLPRDGCKCFQGFEKLVNSHKYNEKARTEQHGSYFFCLL